MVRMIHDVGCAILEKKERKESFRGFLELEGGDNGPVIAVVTLFDCCENVSVIESLVKKNLNGYLFLPCKKRCKCERWWRSP